MISAAFLILSAMSMEPMPHDIVPRIASNNMSMHNGASDDWAVAEQEFRGHIYAQSTIERRVIIRIPMMRRAMPPPPHAEPLPDERERRALAWKEFKGPKCIKVDMVRGAALTSARGIDLMLRNHKRMRALLGRNCRSADLYSGFYIQPDEDGELCAGRDRVLARSGANCEIESIKRLVPER